MNIAGGGAASVTIVDPDVLTALAVRLSGVTCTDADAALRNIGLGTVDQDHAWLDVEALRDGCGVQDEKWCTDFDAMIGFARDRGWVSADATCVRAHCVRADQEA